VWDAESGSRLQVLEGHGREMTCLLAYAAAAPPHDRLVSASLDTTVRRWGCDASDEEIQTPQSLLVRSRDVIFSSHRRYSCPPHAPTVWSDTARPVCDQVRVWDPEAGTLLHTLRRHAQPVCKIVLVSGVRLAGERDGRIVLVSADRGGVMFGWDLGEDPLLAGAVHLRAANKQG
jgi:WD40 repeat protein